MPGRRSNLLPSRLESCHAHNADAGTRREVPHFLVSRASAGALPTMRGGMVRYVRSGKRARGNYRPGYEEVLNVS